MISLKSIYQEIYSDILLNESFRILTEAINPSNHYDYEAERKNMWVFFDKNSVKHFIVIHKDLKDLDAEMGIVKFGWYDSKLKKPRYDVPQEYDERIYNTHIFIFLNEILPNFLQHLNGIILAPTDVRRYRLYRMTLNSHIDKSKFRMEDLGDKLVIYDKG